MDFDIHQLVQYVPAAVRWMESIVPRELQGIVVVLAVVIAIVVFLYWHYSHVGPPVKFAAKKFANRKGKVRSLAETLGFEIEQVERDMPQFSKGSNLYTMAKGKCTRYKWREPLSEPGKWELLCRPGEYSPVTGVLGWVLQGTAEESHKRSVSAVATEIGEPREYFEIGYEGRQLSFYWKETGGMDGLVRLKMLLDLFIKEH